MIYFILRFRLNPSLKTDFETIFEGFKIVFFNNSFVFRGHEAFSSPIFQLILGMK